MRSLVIVLGIVAACGQGSSPRSQSPPLPQQPPPSPPEATPSRASLLAAVGPHPRGYASFSFADPTIRAALVAQASAMSALLGGSLAACHIELDHLERAQVAIGEPLRIAAELDGKIDGHAVACLLGDAQMAALARQGVAIHDRPGGIAIEYQAERMQAERVHADATELGDRCTAATCAVVVLGPPDRRLWVQVGFGTVIHIQLSGPNLRHGAAAIVAAIDGLRASTPALRSLIAREQQGALVIELPGDLSTSASIDLALALRTHLLEAFKIPSSSMIPTLLVDDQVFTVKGPLLGAPVPGDLLVYNQETRPYVKRYLAGPGQTIAETDAGISIDGKALLTEVVDADFHYHDRVEGDARVLERAGTVVREHLGARSYLTLRMGPPSRTGTWTVPAGHLFFLGDSRNNSNDSRYNAATPEDAVIGRVVGIWFALRDGVPDWDRMGVPIE